MTFFGRRVIYLCYKFFNRFSLFRKDNKVLNNNTSDGFVSDNSQALEREKTRIHIRWLTRKDLAQVVSIQGGGFKRNRSPEEFVENLYRRNRVGLVAEYGGQVAGFMVYELTRTQIRLLNLGVADQARSLNIGRRLVEKLIQKLRYDGRTRVVCEVDERNLAAQLFFRACGFRATEILRPHSAKTLDDIYVMQYRLSGARRTAASRPNGQLQKNR